MKTWNYFTILVAITLVGVVQAEFTSSIVYDGTMQEFLHRLDLFEGYGNKTKLIDSENQLVKFQHEHEDGSETYEIYRLEIVERSEDVVEFHVNHQEQEGVDDDENRNDESFLEIDFDSALYSFLGFPLPKSHPLAGNWGRRLSYTIDGQEKDENSQDVLTENGTAVRFSVDDDSGELKRIDIMSIALSSEGFVGKIRAISPEQPTNMNSLSVEEHMELARKLLDKHLVPQPQMQKEPAEIGDPSNDS